LGVAARSAEAVVVLAASVASASATVAEGAMQGWVSQVGQYPKKGEPGIGYRREFAHGDAAMPVDCLLFRNRKGALVGILNHYPLGCGPERPHNVNVWVRPDRQRRGIGSRLVAEALRRWPEIADGRQDYTPAGLALANAIVRNA
jgi:GNAT superfamily N-acetyltransferase